jgi:hypothetical protein
VKEPVPVVKKIFSGVTRRLVVLPQDDGPVGAGFLAEAAKNAAKKIDFIYFGKPLVGRSLGRLHLDALRRTDGRAKFAGNTEDPALPVPGQFMKTSESREHGHLLLRILERNRSGKNLSEG